MDPAKLPVLATPGQALGRRLCTLCASAPSCQDFTAPPASALAGGVQGSGHGAWHAAHGDGGGARQPPPARRQQAKPGKARDSFALPAQEPFPPAPAGHSPTGGTSPASPFQGRNGANGVGAVGLQPGRRILPLPSSRYPLAWQPPAPTGGEKPSGAQTGGTRGGRRRAAWRERAGAWPGSASLPLPEDELMEASWAQPRFPPGPCSQPRSCSLSAPPRPR